MFGGGELGMTMQALSVKQPWAWAIMHAGKDIENRNWPTNFRGRLAIHASKGVTKAEYWEDAAFIEEISGLRPPDYPMLDQRGFIIGTVEVVSCVGDHRSPWFFGEYGFVLAEPRPLVTPIYCKGQLGFWTVPDDVVRQIDEQL
jgi:hypothetical protein